MGMEVWSSGSASQCLMSKSIVVPIHRAIHQAGFELFFNVLVYPFLLFGTQTLEVRERSHRSMWTQLYGGLCHGIDCRWCPMSVPKYPCHESDRQAPVVILPKEGVVIPESIVECSDYLHPLLLAS
jgi:hypothetical protein